MESNNMVKNLIFVLVLAAILFLGYRWWKNRGEVVSSSVVTEEVVAVPVQETAQAPVTEQPIEQAAADIVAEAAPQEVQA